MRACSATAAVEERAEVRDVRVGVGDAVDLGPHAVGLELLEHGLEAGVGRLHLEERLHRVEARRRAHAAGLGGGRLRGGFGVRLRELGAFIGRLRQREAALEGDEVHRRRRGAAALVLARGVGAHRGLGVVLHGQDAVADAEAPEPEQREAARSVVADGLVVGGLAADHAAEGDEAVEASARAGEADRGRGARARPAPRPSPAAAPALAIAARAPASSASAMSR